MNRNCADGIIHLDNPVEEFHAQANQHACDRADDRSADGVYEPTGRCDCYQTRQQPVAGHGSIRFPVPYPHIENRAERTCTAGQHCVHGDGTDAQRAIARSGKRASGIESKPTERQNKTTCQHPRYVVSRNRVGLAPARVFPDAGPDHHPEGEGSHAADGVHDT